MNDEVPIYVCFKKGTDKVISEFFKDSVGELALNESVFKWLCDIQGRGYKLNFEISKIDDKYRIDVVIEDYHIGKIEIYNKEDEINDEKYNNPIDSLEV